MAESKPYRVTRAGDIVRTDTGETIGHVRKVARMTFSSLVGGASTASDYVPVRADGTDIAGRQPTQREAAKRVWLYVQPFEISEIKIERALTGRDVYSTWVHDRGAALGVTRDPREAFWRVDYIQEPGAFMPRYSGGIGVGGYTLGPDTPTGARLDTALTEWLLETGTAVEIKEA